MYSALTARYQNETEGHVVLQGMVKEEREQPGARARSSSPDMLSDLILDHLEL